MLLPIFTSGQIVSEQRPNLNDNEDQYYKQMADWFCQTPQFNLDSAYYYLGFLEKKLLTQKTQDFLKLADVNNKWATIYKDFQFYNKARIKAQAALEYYNKTPKHLKNVKLEADIYWILAISMLYNQEEKKAFQFFTKQDSILRNEKDELSKSKYIQNRAYFNTIYFNGDKELGLKLFEENIPLLKKLGNYNQLVRNYMILAMNFKAINDKNATYFMLRDSVRLYALKARNPYLQVFYPLELTYTMIMNRQYNEAKDGIQTVLREMKKYGLDKSNNYQSALQDIGEIEYKRRDYDKSIEYYKECLEISDSLDIKIMELSLLKIISQIYMEKRDFKSAYEYLNKYNEIYEINEKTLSDRSTEEHELELNLASQKLELEKNKTYSKILVLGLIFLAIGIGYAIYNYHKQNKLNTLLKNNIQQKDILLKEIHHRVKNNLTVISGLLELQSYSLKNDEFELTFKESQNRVKSIALIHQRLYQHESLASIELKEYINDLYSQIHSVFNAKGQVVIFTNQVPTTYLDIDTAVPLGLIINELLTNSFKYAFNLNNEGQIIIDMIKIEEGSYQLIYKDNGKGLVNDINFKNVTSFGLRLVSRLCIQLFGKVEYKKDEKYSVFKVGFKDSIGKMNL